MAVRRSGRQELKRAIELSISESTGNASPPAAEPDDRPPPAKKPRKVSIAKQTSPTANGLNSMIIKLNISRPMDSTDDSELSDLDEDHRPATPPEFRRSEFFDDVGPDSLQGTGQIIGKSVDDNPDKRPETNPDDRAEAASATTSSISHDNASKMAEPSAALGIAPLHLPTPPETLNTVFHNADNQRRSGRATKLPKLYGDLVETGTVVPSDDAFLPDDYDQAEADYSPMVSKQARKAPGAKRLRATAPRPLPGRKRQAAKKEVSTDGGLVLSTVESGLDLQTSSATISQSETQQITPAVPKKTPARKAPKEAPVTFATARTSAFKTPTVQKAPSPLALPSPPDSQPSHQNQKLGIVDPALLELSRTLTTRAPLESKPPTRGQPSVWAPGRQELCETLPYYKSYNSGCYSNNGTVHSFMFDNMGVTREYMDENVIIARMGGKMGKEDGKTGALSQTEDHDINGNQARAVMNNMAHENPLIIICGDKNAGAPARMPHRYCVLDWFKPTHVWAEKTAGKGKNTRVTVRYRFERLDRSNPPWYAPAVSSSDKPLNLTLATHYCPTCNSSSPQVYLRGWTCLNPQCDSFWKCNGFDLPLGELDYNPAFLLQRVRWQKEVPPWDVNPGLPDIGKYSGDHLLYASTRGVVCPKCNRCNTRYLFRGWRCDTAGCDWTLIPQPQVIMPQNLHHTPWDITSDGPSLTKAVVKPAVHIQVKYSHGYKVIRYTIEGVKGSITVAKANRAVVSEPGGPNDMLRELQTNDFGLERRMMRATFSAEGPQSKGNESQDAQANVTAIGLDGNNEDDVAEELKGEVGVRMIAFGMNFGQPYKFIAGGDSRSFEDAPHAVRMARSRMNWAQRTFVSPEGYQDFNEELIFGYMEGQMINYHDDGEEGLGPRIATLSLGGAATMSLRVKAKYFSQVSKTGVFTDEMPLPLPMLQSSGFVSGYSSRNMVKQTSDTYEGRIAAWNELQLLKQIRSPEYKQRSKALASSLGLKKKNAEPLLSFHLTHGDIVIMEGEDIQKYLEHEVEPHGNLRFALTCRTILPHHLKPDQAPKYEVLPDSEGYDGSAIREDGDGDTVVW